MTSAFGPFGGALLAVSAVWLTTGTAQGQTAGSAGGAPAAASTSGAQTTSSAAQSSSADRSASAQIEDIVVTASRYEQSLQRVPIAVSALSANALEQRGVTEVANLSTEVPNLQIGTNGANASVDVSIRGITTANVNTYSNNPAVATYINGVYVPRTQGLNEALFDIDRVEVLRGPQGTLYGRNATAGAINIITTRPSQSPAFRADLTYGNYNSVTARVVANIPVSSTFALRGVAFYNRNDGYQNTLGTTENYFRADELGGRISALWKPGSRLSVLVESDYYRDNGSPNLPIATPVPGTVYPVSQVADPYRTPVTPGQNGIQRVRVFNVRANVDYSFGDNISISYLGGYGTVNLFTFTDEEGLPVAFGTANFDDRNWNTSHEVDLRYTSESLKVVLGGNYTREHTSGDLAIEFLQATGFAPQQLQFPHPNFSQSSYGLFGQATVSVTDALRVTGGLRYSHDQASNPDFGTLFCRRNTPLFVAYNSPLCSRFSAANQESRTYQNVSWKAGAEFDASPTSLLYGSVSTGYKQGILNSVSPLITTPVVNPEKVINYEVGSKNRLLGGRVTLNGALFYMKYTDLQVNQVTFVSVNPPIPTNFTTNAAKATIYGVEVEGAWKITDHDELSGFASYLHARYDDFVNTTDPILDPGNLRPLDLSGNKLIRAPDFSVRASYSHRFDLANRGALSPQASFFYQTASYLREFNQPFDRQPGYSRTDLRLTYEHPGGHWTAEAFVLNLENKAVRVAEYAVSSYLQSFYAPPRRYGVKIAYKY